MRAAALAGPMALGALGALGDLVEIKDGDKPLKLSTGRGMDGTHKELIGELVRKLEFANLQIAHCLTNSGIYLTIQKDSLRLINNPISFLTKILCNLQTNMHNRSF